MSKSKPTRQFPLRKGGVPTSDVDADKSPQPKPKGDYRDGNGEFVHGSTTRANKFKTRKGNEPHTK